MSKSSIIVGSIAFVWGAGIVIGSAFTGIRGEGGFAAGQWVGLLIGIIMALAGGWLLLKGIREWIRHASGEEDDIPVVYPVDETAGDPGYSHYETPSQWKSQGISVYAVVGGVGVVALLGILAGALLFVGGGLADEEPDTRAKAQELQRPPRRAFAQAQNRPHRKPPRRTESRRTEPRKTRIEPKKEAEEARNQESKDPETEQAPVSDEALLLYLDFEGDGDEVHDQSGNGLVAIMKGCRRCPGVIGQGVEMTAPGQYVDLGTEELLNFDADQSFTFSIWVRPESQKGTILSFRRDGDGSPVIDLLYSFRQVSVTIRPDGRELGEGVARGRFSTDGGWHHIAFTRDDSGNIRLFVDGVALGIGRHRRQGPITTNLRALGSERYWLKAVAFGDPNYVGMFDEFRIYGRLLSGKEIRQLARRP